MPKSADEFKQAFKAIKKPKRPPEVSGKMKDLLEKAIGDEDSDTFIANIGIIEKANRGYLVDLVAYKYAKHFDNNTKRPYWQDKVPPDVMKDAMAKIVPDGFDSTLTQKTFEKAVLGGKQSTVDMLFDRDPAAAEQLVFDKLTSLDGKENRDARIAWAGVAYGHGIDTAAFNKRALTEMLSSGNRAGATDMSHLLVGLSEDEIVDYARDDPEMFFETTLHGFKDNHTQFTAMASQKSFRDKMRALDSDAWDAFVAATPMLALLEGVETEIAARNLVDTADVMDAMFAAALDPEKMPLAYVATSIDSNNAIMLGPTDTTDRMREDQKSRGITEVFPDTPATDCHHQLYIFQKMMEMVPGHTPVITDDSCQKMLMTKKLAEIPGRGTLDRSFSGNVFDEGGTPTGRILFTGDDKGANSHTWLVVDGVPYDPVLGTKGGDVKGAEEAQFEWVIYQRLAIGTGAWSDHYAIRDPKLKVARNPMGFSTGYRLTTDPAQFLSKKERETAGL